MRGLTATVERRWKILRQTDLGPTKLDDRHGRTLNDLLWLFTRYRGSYLNSNTMYFRKMYTDV